MIVYLPFFLLIVAVLWLVGGSYNLIRINSVTDRETEKARTRQQKKKPDATVSPARIKRKVLVESVVRVILGLLLLVPLGAKLDIAIIEEAELSWVTGNHVGAAQYEQVIADFISEKKPVGLVVGFLAGEDQYLFAYGHQQLARGRRINEDTRFEIGSITKAITGLMLSHSVHQGVIDLDSSAVDYLSDHRLRSNALLENISIKKLTTHTSGLPRLPWSFGFGLNAWYTSLVGGNPYRNVTTPYIYDHMATTTSVKERGWSYSNYGVGVLGICLGEANGLSYEEMLQQMIVSPLRLSATSSLYHEADLLHYADGYRSVIRIGSLTIGMKSSPWLMDEGMVAAGGIRSTGSDMLLLLEALVQDTLPFVETSKVPLVRVNETRSMGMNWIIDDVDAGQRKTWHNGQTGGFGSYIGFYDELDLGVFVMVNSTEGVEDMQDMAEAILEMLREAAVKEMH